MIDTGGNAVVYIWTESTSQAWAEFMLLIAVVAQTFCLTASTTSASRMLFAFSRDRAVPGHQLWRAGRPQSGAADGGAGDRRAVVAAHGADPLERRRRATSSERPSP